MLLCGESDDGNRYRELWEFRRKSLSQLREGGEYKNFFQRKGFLS